MAQLAIKGHATRGKEVIEILEMLGGKNKYLCKGVLADRMYLIHDFSGNIEDMLSTYEQLPDYQVYTLERFLEKFPYKIGDRVKVCGDNLGIIIGMRWESGYVVYKVKLTKNGYETSKTSENLQPYEEISSYLNRKVNEQAEEIKEILEPVKEIIEERKYSELRTPLDDDDKLATEATIDGNKITPPENYLIGKVTKVDNGMLVEFVKKQPQYPKTYEECCKVLNLTKYPPALAPNKNVFINQYEDFPYYYEIQKLAELLVCRNAYWKIAGEQMGLGKPWEPDACQIVYSIGRDSNRISLCNDMFGGYFILEFPTKEMRDAFYENFKELIEQCKELL